MSTWLRVAIILSMAMNVWAVYWGWKWAEASVIAIAAGLYSVYMMGRADEYKKWWSEKS